jgi:putative membrane protein
MLAALVSALHLLALGIGLGSIFSRSRALRAVARGEAHRVRDVLLADNLWGLAAALWIATGLTRVFGGLEKSLDFYMFNGLFWVKMSLFASVFLLELGPIATFIRWRIDLKKGSDPDTRSAARLATVSRIQLVLVVLIVFTAAAMARGLWLIA